jgi:hypothetical protein
MSKMEIIEKAGTYLGAVFVYTLLIALLWFGLIYPIVWQNQHPGKELPRSLFEYNGEPDGLNF